uniref:Uncharacterized protein n=1 Tax=Anguilla anguilla TaxID=7936 RepID=A0A0E9WV50_ANGAN
MSNTFTEIIFTGEVFRIIGDSVYTALYLVQSHRYLNHVSSKYICGTKN